MPIKTALLSKTHPMNLPPRRATDADQAAMEAAREAFKKRALVHEICSALAALDPQDPAPTREP